MTDLTNAYALHSELVDLQKTVSEEKTALRANRYAQQFFTIGTWIIYLLFAASMYAAPLWVLQAFFGANAGNYLAVAVIGVFLLVFPTALALGKHAGYKALSKRGIDPRYMGAIIAFFIASGIYFEMTSATSQQQEKAHQAVENSNAGKAIMGTTVSTGTGDTAALIADAEFKLVACQRKVDEGKTKDCKNSQARLDALKSQANADRQAAIVANTQAITAKQEALEKERESHALPIAKSFSELLGSSVATGAVIAALIASLIFEISHSLTIFNEWRLRGKIDALDAEFKQMKVNYFHHTGKQFNAGDFKDTQVIDLDKMRESGQLQGAIPSAAFSPAPVVPGLLQRAGQAIAGEMAQAQTARNQLHQNLQSGANRLADALSDPAQVRESGGFRQSPEQLARARDLAADDTGSTYRQELRNGSHQFKDVPLDHPTPTAGTVSESVLPTVPARSETVPDTVPARSQNGIGETLQNGLTDDGKQAENRLYPEWKSKVSSREISPGARDCKRFISQSTKSKDDKTGLTVQEMGRIWLIWQGRAVADGILKPNPDYSNGKPKFILA